MVKCRTALTPYPTARVLERTPGPRKVSIRFYLDIQRVRRYTCVRVPKMVERSLGPGIRPAHRRAIWNAFISDILKPCHAKLGYVLVVLPESIVPTAKMISCIREFYQTVELAALPKIPSFAFDFRNRAWRTSERVLALFGELPEWCIATPFVENGLINAGWAGNLKSTRPRCRQPGGEEPIITTDWTVFLLYGSTGHGYGRYDHLNFLESLARRVDELSMVGGVEDTYFTFLATSGHPVFPLPEARIGGFAVNVMAEPVEMRDRLAAIHDLVKFREVLTTI